MCVGGGVLNCVKYTRLRGFFWSVFYLVTYFCVFCVEAIFEIQI